MRTLPGDRFEPVYLTDTRRTPLLACRPLRFGLARGGCLKYS
jgi:hypothetical protein